MPTTSYSRTIVEQAGYSRLRLPGGINVLRLADGERDTIEAWFEDCNKLMSRWLPDQRLRYLHDIRAAEFVTPHAIDRVTQVLRRMRYTPIADGRGAVVLNSTAISSLLGIFFKRRPGLNWKIRFFSDEKAALRWLSESNVE
jgi:hypothetical protein